MMEFLVNFFYTARKRVFLVCVCVLIDSNSGNDALSLMKKDRHFAPTGHLSGFSACLDYTNPIKHILYSLILRYIQHVHTHARAHTHTCTRLPQGKSMTLSVITPLHQIIRNTDIY